ncbi:MAG: hypothetical protein OXI30_00065 [Chloroflexota bacterium]|nr:hypothetical protein [Chloroflexota bacterium]
MTRTGRRAAVIFGLALALVPLVLFAYFGINTRMLGDDYIHLGLASKYGIWEALLHFRGNWNGHYSSFLVFGLSAPLGTAAPPFFAVAQLASALVAFSWLVNAVLAQLRVRSYRRAFSVALAALAVAATINGLYSAHSFYWFSSAVHYTLSAVMFMLGIVLAVESARRLRGVGQHALAAIGAAIYAFLTAGLAEMYLVYQLSALALMTVSVFIFQTGSKRRTYLLLTLAANLGTLVGLAVVLNAPGFANRSDATIVGNFLLLPLLEQLRLSVYALNETLLYAGDREVFAGYMLVVFAGTFVALSAVKPGPTAGNQRRAAIAKRPIAFALIVQLFFVPILWSHQSDQLQVLGRFSYSFLLVVCINLCIIIVLLAVLWRRSILDALLKKRDGLATLCSGILLIASVLFMMTQVREIHVKAASYLFFTTVTLLIMLASQLAWTADEQRLNRLFSLSVCVIAGAILTLAFVVSVEIFLVRYVNRRSISAAVFAMMIAGLLHGLTLGALIRHGLSVLGARAVWRQWLRLGCLVAALTIGAGIVIGQSRRIGYFQEFVQIWEAQHQEIIRLRDEGEPAVLTMDWKRIVPGKMDQDPPVYARGPLSYKERIFYRLEGTREYE